MSERGQSLRPGTSLEERVASLLRNMGYYVEQHKILAGHEIDVWGEDNNGKTIAVECKEHYTTGPITTHYVVKFIGVIADLQKVMGVPDEAMFVSITGFIDEARDMLERNGIIPLDREALLSLEQRATTLENIKPSHSIHDRAILKLTMELQGLKRELRRREQINSLSAKIEKLKLRLELETLPSFLQPAKMNVHVLYSNCKRGEVPIIGLEGSFVDFLVLNYPLIDYILFSKKGFLGEKLLLRPPGALTISQGIITIRSIPHEEIQDYSEHIHSKHLLKRLVDMPVFTLNNIRIGRIMDFIIGILSLQFAILAVKIDLDPQISDQVKQKVILIPSSRTTLEKDRIIVLAKLIQV